MLNCIHPRNRVVQNEKSFNNRSYLLRDIVRTFGGLWMENLFWAGTFCLHLKLKKIILQTMYKN